VLVDKGRVICLCAWNNNDDDADDDDDCGWQEGCGNGRGEDALIFPAFPCAVLEEEKSIRKKKGTPGLAM
jgi:hypothetical protein